MGCWNGTCGISHLPIYGGTAVRGVLITGVPSRIAGPGIIRDPETWSPEEQPEYVDDDGGLHLYQDKEQSRTLRNDARIKNQAIGACRNGWWSGYVSSTPVFFARTVPFKGSYDDYGRIEHVKDGLHKQIILEQFQEDLDEYPAYKGSIIPAISKADSFGELIYAIGQGVLTVKNDFRSYDGMRSSPVGLWMVREDIFQGMLGASIERNYDDNVFTLKTYEDAAKAYKEGLAVAAENERTVRSLRSAGDHKAALDLITANGGALRKIENRFSRDPIRSYLSRDIHGNSPGFYDDWIIDRAIDGSLDTESEAFNELLRDIVEGAFFSATMDSMRMGYMPQAGAGSQDDCISVHAAVAKQTLRTIEQMRAEWAEE